MDLKEKTIRLIDDLKATCQSYGLGNDGNEYKIITQIFLYKFLNDKFGYELKKSKNPVAKKISIAESGIGEFPVLGLTDFLCNRIL